jgi:nicotinamide mononucleotide transporter
MIGELSTQLVGAWHNTGWIEFTAAVLAVLYLVLAIRQLQACWAAAFVSSCLYVWVFFGAHLYMESALNGFYAAMAIYGFQQWRHGGGQLAVCRWPLARHLAGFAGVAALSVASSFFLRRYTPAAWPFLDSMVTWSSVFATFLVARKVYENWHWWLVIDAVSLGLDYSRRLYLTMLLFALYLILIVVGMRQWRRTLPAAAHAAA